VPLAEQKMFTLPEHLLSLPFFIAHSAHVPRSNFLYSVLPILLIWLFVLLLAIVLSVHQFTASRHPFGIYMLFRCGSPESRRTITCVQNVPNDISTKHLLHQIYDIYHGLNRIFNDFHRVLCKQ
jgi:hypothetical protein